MADGIVVKILGDDSDLKKKLSESGAAVAKWGAAAAAAAAATTAALVKSGLESADAQAKLAAQLNTTSQDLATLQRAGDMAGVSQEKLGAASRALTTRLSQVASGTGEAKLAFEALGLSVEEIQALPLSERIATINTALMENVDASQRAAIASKLYGEEAGLAVSRIDAGTISLAAEQVEKMGAALSEIDAAKVEAANDAMSRIGLFTSGVTKQLAAEFAPALQGISDILYELVSDTDQLGNVGNNVFSATITGAGFAANAWRGIEVAIAGLNVAYEATKAAALSVAASIATGFDSTVNASKIAINGLIEIANNLPGIDLEQLTVGESEFVSNIRGMAEKANEGFAKAVDAMHKKAMEPLPSEQLDEWVSVVAEKSEAAAKASADAKALEREQALIDAEDQLSFDAEQYQLRLDALAAYEEAKLGTIRLYKSEEIKTEKDAQQAKINLAKAEAKARRQITTDMLANLSTLMDTENRKLFQIGKVAALANATINGYEAVVSSYARGAEIGGPALGAAYAATAGIATAVQIANIASTNYGSGGGGVASAAGSSTPVSDATQVGGPAQQQERVFRFEGVDPGSLYSGEQLVRLADSLVELQNDGYRLVPS